MLMTQGLILPIFMVFFSQKNCNKSGGFQALFLVLNGTAVIDFNKAALVELSLATLSSLENRNC